MPADVQKIGTVNHLSDKEHHGRAVPALDSSFPTPRRTEFAAWPAPRRLLPSKAAHLLGPAPTPGPGGGIMKALRYGIICLLAAGPVLVAACGGSDAGGDSTGGANAGGASHSAGAPGNAGRTSTAGTGPGNSACPATVPEDASACTAGGQTTCDYSGMSCRCARM